ncbi:CRTAM protein, partial [Rostratula benghalensis]|nr:CRTAM protein [Rostratula benghalensis]
ARQWLNPRGFAIFLNTRRALRDERYKLIHHSEGELSIQLSNVTVHDEGVYKCFYYGTPFQSENKTLEVLAAPSNPVLEVSRDTESSITLYCHTQGCKPQPQITWLLDNGIELPGDTKHELEADGKKWTTTSTLRVLAHGPNSTASCIVRHQALGEERPMASFRFEDLPRMGTACSFAPMTSNTAVLACVWSPQIYSQEEPGLSPLDAEHQQPDGPPQQEGVSPGYLKSEGIKKKENNLLLPILVAALIFVLLIIVLLFMRKLKKAHGVWKRENDASEQTLESYKSKSNEDSPGHEKNGQ